MGKWEIIRLGDHIEITNGFAFDSKLFTTDKECLPLVRIRDIGNVETQVYTKQECDDKYIITEGDLLIGMDGEFNLSVWKGGHAALNQRVCKIKAIDVDLLDDYLRFVLPAELKKIEAVTPYVTVKHLSTKKLKDIRITLPPLEVQKKITSILATQMNLIFKRVLQIEKLDLLIKSQFIQMFGNPIKTSYSVHPISDLVRLELIDRPLDGNHGDLHPKSSDYVKEGVPFVMANTLQDGIINYDKCNYITVEQAKTLRKGIAKYGDVLLTHKGTIGRTAIVNGNYERVILTPQITYYRIIKGLNNKYLKSFFDSNYFQQQLKMIAEIGSTRQYVSITEQAKLFVVVPPIVLQNQFANFVQKVEQQKAILEQSLTKMEQNYKSLMQKCFRGEIFS